LVELSVQLFDQNLSNNDELTGFTSPLETKMNDRKRLLPEIKAQLFLGVAMGLLACPALAHSSCAGFYGQISTVHEKKITQWKHQILNRKTSRWDRCYF